MTGRFNIALSLAYNYYKCQPRSLIGFLGYLDFNGYVPQGHPGKFQIRTLFEPLVKLTGLRKTFKATSLSFNCHLFLSTSSCHLTLGIGTWLSVSPFDLHFSRIVMVWHSFIRYIFTFIIYFCFGLIFFLFVFITRHFYRLIVPYPYFILSYNTFRISVKYFIDHRESEIHRLSLIETFYFESRLPV